MHQVNEIAEEVTNQGWDVALLLQEVRAIRTYALSAALPTNILTYIYRRHSSLQVVLRQRHKSVRLRSMMHLDILRRLNTDLFVCENGWRCRW